MKTCPICNGPLQFSTTQWRDGDTVDYHCPTKVNLDIGQYLFHYEVSGLSNVTYLIFYPYRIIIDHDVKTTTFQLYIPEPRAVQIGRKWDAIWQQSLMSEQRAIQMLTRLKNLIAFS
jgi:hypothetical protein